jgi:hypothetical protein
VSWRRASVYYIGQSDTWVGLPAVNFLAFDPLCRGLISFSGGDSLRHGCTEERIAGSSRDRMQPSRTAVRVAVASRETVPSAQHGRCAAGFLQEMLQPAIGVGKALRRALPLPAGPPQYG